MRAWLIACLLAISSLAQAEVFYGINYMETLGSIKKKYPGADYEVLTPAWLQPDQKFIWISGFGLRGNIGVIFIDPRPSLKISSRDETLPPGRRKLFASLAEQTDEDALMAIVVRIIYESPVEFDLFKKKYGTPVCYVNEDFRKLCKFSDRAMVAELSKDEKFVEIASSDFTAEERKRRLSIRQEAP